MILTGSINILSTIQQLKSESLISDMPLLKLKPLRNGESILFFRSLLKSKQIQILDEALDFCVTKIRDGVHYFIQVFADEISKNYKRGELIQSRETIEAIYNELIQSHLPSFSDFHTRLSKYFSQARQTAARKILANLASGELDFDDLFALAGEVLENDKQIFHALLLRLCDEGYLFESGKKFSFISIFLADYWYQHYYFEK
jgi:hypothetical protein